MTGMVNWYRALLGERLAVPAPGSIKPPVMILWGDQGAYGVNALADESAALCADVVVEHFADATHWVLHGVLEAVRAALLGFLERQ